ncbi:phage protein [Streptococcus pneumoniae]|nr:phage protein [Streptococcus pneumoniae]VTG89710.1 phage protein [Streptococcus pneumoniae]
MNVQRLIEKYKKLEGVWDAEGAELARQIFLQDLEQLDEQKPVKVPQCVADWYEANKDNLDYNIWEYIYEWDNQKNPNSKAGSVVQEKHSKPSST